MGLLPFGTMNRSASSLQSRIKGFGLPVRSTHLPTVTSGSLGRKNKCSTRPQGICYNRNGSFLVGSAALALGLSSATWTYSPDFGKVGERRYFWKWARGKAVRCEEREKGKKDEKEGWGMNVDVDIDTIISKLPKVSPSLSSLKDSLTALGESFSDFRSKWSIIINEVTRGEGSLYKETVDELSRDEKVNPEIEWDAQVRLVGNDSEKGEEGLSHVEKAFRRNRRGYMKGKFAELVGVREDEVDERDIPIIAIAGSGGGYRAMVNLAGTLRGAQHSGVLDVTSYIAAISGSAWCLAQLYSLADCNVDKLVDHIKRRITMPFLHPSTLDLLTTPPTNKYLMAGPILKQASKGGTTSLVDIYGVLVASRLFVPDDLSDLDPFDLKLSSQRKHIEDGRNPFPIYSMCHHMVPEPQKVLEIEKDRVQASQKGPQEVEAEKAKEREEILSKSKWLWYEANPYEVGSDELGAYIPTWSFGRLFENGKSVERQPELSLTILSGIFASAFCATLFHYYNEVKPALQTFSFFDGIQTKISELQKDLEAIHPFPPAEIANFTKGLDEGQLRDGAPLDVVQKDTIGLMDAGAELNIPYVPLFKRECDIILAFDASNDSQDLWFSRAESYALARGSKRWPKVNYSGPFPQAPQAESESKETEKESNSAKSTKGEGKADSEKGKEADKNVGEETRLADERERSTGQSEGNVDVGPREPPLGTFNLWVGHSEDEGPVDKEERQSSRMVDIDEEEIIRRDGCALVYYPLFPGNGLQPAETWSTWKFEYPMEETDRLVQLAEDNFRHDEEKLKQLIKAVWKRKKEKRLGMEKSG